MNRRELVAGIAAGLGQWVVGGSVFASGLPDGRSVLQRVNQRSRGRSARMRLEMVLEDEKRGEFRKDIEAWRQSFEGGYRTRYAINAPEHEEGICLLLAEDPALRGMWMFFPANRQLLHVASRGLSALASDFSCEDLLVHVPLSDYAFESLGWDELAGQRCLRVAMKPASERLQLELGFARAVGWVREDLDVIVRAEYEDRQGKVFKSFTAEDIERIDGVWTVRKFSMRNTRARHATAVRVSEIDYRVSPDPSSFRPEWLGGPKAGR